MSELSKNKKYLQLDEVRVSYNPKNDTIHLTSADPDLEGKSFHLTLKQNSETESVIRDLLIEKGLIHEDKKNLPFITHFDWEENAKNPWEFPIGIGAKNEVISWNPKKNLNIMAVGQPGQGKTVMLQNLFYHCVAHNDLWSFYGVDLNKKNFFPFNKYADTVKNMAHSLEETHSMLTELVEIMFKRYDAVENEGVQHYDDVIIDHGKNILFVFEDLFHFNYKKANTEFGKIYNEKMEEIGGLLKELLSLGNRVNIFVAVSTHNLNHTILSADWKHRFETYFVSGPINGFVSNLVLGNHSASDLPPILGRSIVAFLHEQKVCQAFFTTPEHAFEWVKKNGNESWSKR